MKTLALLVTLLSLSAVCHASPIYYELPYGQARLLSLDMGRDHAALSVASNGDVVGEIYQHGTWQCDVHGTLSPERCLSLELSLVRNLRRCYALQAAFSMCLIGGQ